jgi:hypothetical protein
LLTIFTFKPAAAVQSHYYSPQVGAYGDFSSAENVGVQVDIRTHLYNATPGDLDYFWVGDGLLNGAFIQFGYSFEPGICSKDAFVNDTKICVSELGNDDARWQWQYWPDGSTSNITRGIGDVGSVGVNGTWHTYTIEPNSTGYWSFLIDGKEVASIPDYVIPSQTPAYFIAGKVTGSLHFTNLGPVEFRNLKYLGFDGWHTTSGVLKYVGCAANTNCNFVNPYWVTNVSGDYIAGSLQKPMDPTLTLEDGTQSVIVDDRYAVRGTVPLPLPAGQHTLTLITPPPYPNGTRFVFDHWSDNSINANRTIQLNSNMSLATFYIAQYKLTIVSYFPTSGAGWYTRGSIANFSTVWSPQLRIGQFGIMRWKFIGWTNTWGAMLLTSNPGSIPMNGPNTLVAMWNSRDVTRTISGAIASVAVGTFLSLGVRLYGRKVTESQSRAVAAWIFRFGFFFVSMGVLLFMALFF